MIIVMLSIYFLAWEKVILFAVSCRSFELYGHEGNIKFVRKEFPLQDIGPQKCVAFSVDGSKLATGGIVSNFIERLFLLYFMRILPCSDFLFL